MPQYVPSQFVAGMGIGAQLVNKAMDDSARAVAGEAQQAYATTDYFNKVLDKIASDKEMIRRGINPVNGNPLDAGQRINADTYGADIVQRIYDYYLTRGNVRPGGAATAPQTAITEGGQAWIVPTARFPGVPAQYLPSDKEIPLMGMYTSQTLPMLQQGTLVPFSTKNQNQLTRGE
jgi:hypothetical protein